MWIIFLRGIWIQILYCKSPQLSLGVLQSLLSQADHIIIFVFDSTMHDPVWIDLVCRQCSTFATPWLITWLWFQASRTCTGRRKVCLYTLIKRTLEVKRVLPSRIAFPEHIGTEEWIGIIIAVLLSTKRCQLLELVDLFAEEWRRSHCPVTSFLVRVALGTNENGIEFNESGQHCKLAPRDKQRVKIALNKKRCFLCMKRPQLQKRTTALLNKGCQQSPQMTKRSYSRTDFSTRTHECDQSGGLSFTKRRHNSAQHLFVNLIGVNF